MVSEAALEQTEAGLVSVGPGWFVLNAREASWNHREGRGKSVNLTGSTDEEVEAHFRQLGVNLFLLGPPGHGSRRTFDAGIKRHAVARWRRGRNGVQVTGNAAQEVDAIISNADDWRGDMLAQLRGIVLAADPAIDETLKWKKPSRPEGVPVWSSAGIVCIGEMLKNAVRLTFPKGAQLKDPKQLFNARLDSKSVRAIDVPEGGQLPEAALTALVRDAVALNG